MSFFFTAQIASLVVSFVLPSVKQSLYFYPNSNSQSTVTYNGQSTVISSSVTEPTEKPIKFSAKSAAKLLWRHLSKSFSNSKVILWSFWWAFAMSGFLQV